MNPLRWGVLGVSELVGRKAVLPALRRSPTADLVAVGSRDLKRAENEAAQFGARRAYGDYASVLADPDVQAVYLPLPNSLHLPWALAAAKAGKHVLCEKPLACSAAEAGAMARACSEAGVVLMEAYMTPFHPRTQAVLEAVQSGRLGALRFAHSAFTFTAADPERKNYRWLPQMGGGALLDVGIYCLAPLLDVAGLEPSRVAARAVLASTGVDASFSGWLDFGQGFTASFEVSFEAPERQVLEITGTEGHLEVERAFTPGPDDTTFLIDAQPVATAGNDPYLAMVEHFAAVVHGEARPLRTPVQSVALLALLDRVRGAARQ